MGKKAVKKKKKDVLCPTLTRQLIQECADAMVDVIVVNDVNPFELSILVRSLPGIITAIRNTHNGIAKARAASKGDPAKFVRSMISMKR